MTLTELRYIVNLAEEMHFGRAAKRCHVSQPTLSVAIKKFEDELGVTLFERSRSNLSITDIGQRMVDQARLILDQVHVMKDLADDGKTQLHAPLKVGAIYTVGPYLLPHLMPQIIRVASDMSLYIEENYTHVLREKLIACELDAILIALPFQVPDILTMPLYDEPFVVLMPTDHPLCEYDEIDVAQLSQHNLLMLGAGHCFREQILAAAPGVRDNLAIADIETSQDKKLITEGSSLETIKHMVASGYGITVAPYSAALVSHVDEALIQVRPFKAPVPMRTIALAWRATFPRPQAIDLLSLACKQCQVVSAPQSA